MTLPSGNGNQTGHVQGVFWCWWWWWTSTKETRRRWMDGWRLIIFPVNHCPAWVNFSDDEQEEQKEAQEDVLMWFDFLTLCCFVASNKWHFSLSKILLWSSRLLRVPSFSIIALQSSIISISFFACPFSNDPSDQLDSSLTCGGDLFQQWRNDCCHSPSPRVDDPLTDCDRSQTITDRQVSQIAGTFVDVSLSQKQSGTWNWKLWSLGWPGPRPGPWDDNQRRGIENSNNNMALLVHWSAWIGFNLNLLWDTEWDTEPKGSDYQWQRECVNKMSQIKLVQSSSRLN